MSKKLIQPCITLLLCMLFFSFHPERKDLKKARQNAMAPVAVIELFSSDGCSSCPPAGDNLSDALRDAQKTKRKIFCLDFHVDYWDNKEWKDPLSQKAFTKRQMEYVRRFKLKNLYTPQMIVNGVQEFDGADTKQMETQILNAMLLPSSVVVDLSPAIEIENSKEKIVCVYKVRGQFDECVINMALVEKSITVKVKGGENKGRSFTHHNVVKGFTTKDLSGSTNGLVEFDRSIIKDLKNAMVIAYVQTKEGTVVVGAAEADIQE